VLPEQRLQFEIEEQILQGVLVEMVDKQESHYDVVLKLVQSRHQESHSKSSLLTHYFSKS